MQGWCLICICFWPGWVCIIWSKVRAKLESKRFNLGLTTRSGVSFLCLLDLCETNEFSQFSWVMFLGVNLTSSNNHLTLIYWQFNRTIRRLFSGLLWRMSSLFQYQLAWMMYRSVYHFRGPVTMIWRKRRKKKAVLFWTHICQHFECHPIYPWWISADMDHSVS